MRVLVVDDDPHVRSKLSRLLVLRYKADVIEAHDGTHALVHLLGSPCDLVLLDYEMKGMNGMETLRAIRRSPNHKMTPVMMLTGVSDMGSVVKALGLGVVDYLVKPVDAMVLFDRIAVALARCGRESLIAGEAGEVRRHPPVASE